VLLIFAFPVVNRKGKFKGKKKRMLVSEETVSTQTTKYESCCTSCYQREIAINECLFQDFFSKPIIAAKTGLNSNHFYHSMYLVLNTFQTAIS